MDALEALTTRVSGKDLVEPAPDELELHAILSAALRAPDHGHLRPWRISVVRGAAREKLGALMVDALRRRHPDATPAQLDKERNRPLRAPLVLVVGAKVDTGSHSPAIEQVLSAGCAAENIMVAAHALGYGCAWKTGEAAYDPEVKAAFGFMPADAIVAFLYLGTSSTKPPPPAPPEIDAHVVEWRNADPARHV